jgi:outer membrane protein OmpA-like peptidoglycan-associated protein
VPGPGSVKPATPPAAKITPPPGGPKLVPPSTVKVTPPPSTVSKPPVQTLQTQPVQKQGVTQPQQQFQKPKLVTPTPGPQQNIQQVAPIAPTATTPTSVRRLDDFRKQRREIKQGERTVIQEPGRTIVREGGRLVIHHNETARFRSSARSVRTERQGQNVATIAVRANGVQIVNLTDSSGRLLRRSRRDARGREVVLIDNTRRGRAAAGVAALAATAFILNISRPRIRIPRDRYIVEMDRADRELIYETLMAPPVDDIERDYSLDEIRYNAALRDRMRRVDIDTITFDTGSWEVRPDQVERLQVIADAILRAIEQNPDEIFMIEGYTDAVGNDVDNISLSDRRAEAVAQLLTEQFKVPPENLTTQGYGEQELKVPTDGPDERNRRVTVRRITPLLNGGVAQRQ